MNIIKIDLETVREAFNQSFNPQPYNMIEYEKQQFLEKINNHVEIQFPNYFNLLEEPQQEPPLKDQQIKDDQQIQINMKDDSDTLSLSFISDKQQSFNIQEIPYWFKDFAQYGQFFRIDTFIVNFIKTNKFHNILSNNFTIIIDQGQDTKLYSGFNHKIMDWVVIKEQVVQDNRLLIAAKQFIIHDQIYKLYPNMFLQLIQPVYIKELVETNKFQFISQLEYGEINLYNYSQQKLIEDQEYKLIFQQIYQQIILMHNHNIAHRDIKPQNIVYVENKGWLLCDFGDSLKYEKVDEIYDIRGTKAFLLTYLQLLSHAQGISIKQNLFVNDMYALAITLIIIKFQIKHQDEIQNYINQPEDIIIEQLIKNPYGYKLEKNLVRTEQSYVKIQLKNYQEATTLNQLSISDIFSFANIIKNQKLLPDQNKEEIQLKILSLLDQKLAQHDQLYENINYICYKIIPEYTKFLKNVKKYKVYRQSKYWKKIFYSNRIKKRNFLILQIIFMDQIGLTDIVIHCSRIFLSNDYDFLIHLLIIKNLFYLDQQELATQEYNLITKYREFKEMTAQELQLFKLLSLNILDWNKFDKEDTKFISEYVELCALDPKSLLVDTYEDRQSLQLLATNILSQSINSIEKQFFLPHLLQFIIEVSNYIEISRFTEFLDIMKSKIKYFCTTFFWQKFIKYQANTVQSLNNYNKQKLFLKEMNYVMIYNSESQQQYKFLKIQKLLTYMHQNIKCVDKEKKIFQQVFKIITKLEQVTTQLYRDQILFEVICNIGAYVQHNEKYEMYHCLRILIFICNRPNYILKLNSLVLSIFIATTSNCFRLSSNLKRYCQFIKNGDERMMIKNFVIRQSQRNKQKTQVQCKRSSYIANIVIGYDKYIKNITIFKIKYNYFQSTIFNTFVISKTKDQQYINNLPFNQRQLLQNVQYRMIGVNQTKNSVLIQDPNQYVNEYQIDLDEKMNIYIKQAYAELERLIDVKKRILEQLKLIQQQIDYIYMFIRKQTKQIRFLIDDHLDWTKGAKGYSQGFNNLISKQIYENLISMLEQVPKQIQSLNKKLEQNFTQYFQNTEVYSPCRDFLTHLRSYDNKYIILSGQILAACISNDQKQLLCSSQTGELLFWDLFNFCERKRQSVNDPINSICFSKFENIAYLGRWSSIQIMDLNDFNIIKTTYIHGRTILNIIEKEQNVIITWSQDQIIKITNVKIDNQLLVIQNQIPFKVQINNVDYSHEHNIILSSNISQILLWNAQDGQQVACFETDFDQVINQTYFSQKQDKIVAISFKSNIINVYNYDHKNINLVIFNKFKAESNLMCISWTQQDQILTCIIDDKICFIPVLGQNQTKIKYQYKYVTAKYPKYILLLFLVLNLFISLKTQEIYLFLVVNAQLFLNRHTKKNQYVNFLIIKESEIIQIVKLSINSKKQLIISDYEDQSQEPSARNKSGYVPSEFLEDKLEKESQKSSPINSVEVRQRMAQSPQNIIPKLPYQNISLTSLPLPTKSDNKQDEPSKIKTQPNTDGITAGYTKYIIDENNQQYDYIKGMFTEEEIKETFNILDLNKDGGIGAEDLFFFLDFIGERPTQEEVEEMIRLCDYDGSGEVRFEEFRKLARGDSLAPLGQAFPPSKELVEKRNLLNQMMMEKDIQEISKKGKITPAMFDEIKKIELASPRFAQDEQAKSMFQSINNIAAQSGSKKLQIQYMGQNLKVVRSEEGQITSQNKQKSQLPIKEIMNQRKSNAIRFVFEKKIDIRSIQDLLEKIYKIDSCDKTNYDEFREILQISDNSTAKLLFNSLTESPVREEYAKNSEDIIFEQNVNLKHALLTFLGIINCRKQDKLEMAYQIQDMNQKGFISFDDLLYLLVYLHCIADIPLIEQKLLKMTAKKGIKDRKGIIKRDVYISMINEYGQAFESQINEILSKRETLKLITSIFNSTRQLVVYKSQNKFNNVIKN
ncbi:hypothetical protein pb186bvf_000262 [Paramecium bursaria]